MLSFLKSRTPTGTLKMNKRVVIGVAASLVAVAMLAWSATSSAHEGEHHSPGGNGQPGGAALTALGPTPCVERHGLHLPVQQHRSGRAPAHRGHRRHGERRHHRERGVGLDRPADGQGVRHPRPLERRRVRGRVEPGSARPPRQPADAYYEFALAHPEGLPKPCLRRRRRYRRPARDAGLRPDAAARGRVAARHVQRDGPLRRLQHGSHDSHQRGDGLPLRRREHAHAGQDRRGGHLRRAQSGRGRAARR